MSSAFKTPAREEEMTLPEDQRNLDAASPAPATVFNAFDTNSGETLDEEEANALIRSLFPHYSSAQVRSCFETIDANHSGEIDREEFDVWWEAEMTGIRHT
eukprot:COSAG02_NODE_6397_length_3599_cov_8.635143_6_plen_101_part_00